MNKITKDTQDIIISLFDNKKIEPSYKNLIYKKVNNCDIFLAIPDGTKCFIWFTYFNNQNVCILFELNQSNDFDDLSKKEEYQKNNNIHTKFKNVSFLTLSFHESLSYDSIFYGTLFNIKNQKKYIALEDIFYYKGKNVSNLQYNIKLELFKVFFDNDILQYHFNNNSAIIGLVFINNDFDKLQEIINKNITCYKIKYIYYRFFNVSKKCLFSIFNRQDKITSYSSCYSFSNETKINKNYTLENVQSNIYNNNYNNNQNNNYNNNQNNNYNNNHNNNYNNNHNSNHNNNHNNNYNNNHNNNYNNYNNNYNNNNQNNNQNNNSKNNNNNNNKTSINKYNKYHIVEDVIFIVKADIKTDIYNLFAIDSKGLEKFYDVAYIPNYKSSIMMNILFRNIKENKNIDFIEESDDEEDFENTDINKYVYLNKKYNMICSFNKNFKKYIPKKITDDNNIISYEKLTKYK